MSDEGDIPRKKFLVGLLLSIALGLWIGVSQQLLSVQGIILGWCLFWMPVIVLFGRWKPR